MPKCKPLIVEIIYRPPNQSNFVELINANSDKVDADTKEYYIIGDFNINMYQNVSFHFSFLCKFYTISKFRRINKSFHRILFILSGDISLNRGSVYNSQSSCLNQWNVFKAKRNPPNPLER